MTHSTAESELVAYCESLLIGRASEALLCAMWGEPLKANQFSRVIYGDNLAAIGLATGTTCSSWRTRHLRIRAAILKEAIEESEDSSGGQWRLLHLKGSELVADGLTKQLNGQAFARFVQDLSIKRHEPVRVEKAPQEFGGAVQNGGGEGNQMAVKAIMAGSLLVSSARAMEHDGEDQDEMGTIFVAGVVLMALGAVYTGQLIYGASQCCLRRMRAAGEAEVLADLVREERQRDVVVVSEDEDAMSGSRRTLSKGTGASSTRAFASSSRNRTSSSGPIGTLTPILTSRSGSESVATLSMRQRSGMLGAVVNSGSATTSTSTRSGSAVARASSLSTPSQLGCGSTGELAVPPTAAAAASKTEAGSRVEDEGDGANLIKNSWNAFQHQYKDRGMTSSTLAAMYRDRKS